MRIACYCSAVRPPHEHNNGPTAAWPCPVRPVLDPDEPESDPVSRPSHYVGPGRCQECGEAIECRDVVVHMPWAVGTAMKYLWRAGRKSDDAITDLRKAVECVQMEIARRERLAVLAERAEREW